MLIDSSLKPVADRFFEQVKEQPYGGAALAIYLKGKPVMDIWAGESRPGQLWQEDTKTVIFSTTKGILTILVLQLVEQGLLDIDKPVAHYWPEFAAGGKSEITVKMVLRHRAGMNTTGRDLTFEEVLNPISVEEVLAAQEPIYPPDSGFVYHALTIGHLLGKIIFNITGKRVNQLLQERIAAPLNVPIWIGVPENNSLDIARLKSDLPDELPVHPVGSIPYKQEHAMGFHGLNRRMDSDDRGWNDPRLHRAEFAGAGGMSDARSIAKIYSACVTNAHEVRLINDKTVKTAISFPNPGDSIYNEPQPHPIHSLGFIVANDQYSPAPSDTLFGHNGFGGQQGMGDLKHQIGFGYVTNWVPTTENVNGMLRHRELTRILIDCLK